MENSQQVLKKDIQRSVRRELLHVKRERSMVSETIRCCLGRAAQAFSLSMTANATRPVLASHPQLEPASLIEPGQKFCIPRRASLTPLF
jgi:hypothetical protein